MNTNSIKEYLNNNFCIKTCLFFVCFLLPTHWFWHWDPSWSFWSGIQREPWIPKIFVSSIFVILLWGASLFPYFFQGVTRGRQALVAHFRQFFLQMRKTEYFGAFSLVGIVLINTYFSLVPQATVWFWFQTMLGPGLLLLWISVLRKKVPWETLWAGILAGICLQAVLAWWQYWTQTSLGGYWMFGQPDFSSIFLTKSQVSDQVFTLPYGSTPHPNILGGWLVLGVLIIWYQKILDSKLSQVLLSLGLLFPLAWTESWSAWGTLILFGILFKMKKWLTEKPTRMWFVSFVLWFCFTFGVILATQVFPQLSQNPSWSHRVTMLKAAPRLLLERPQGWGIVQHPIGYSPQEVQKLRSMASQPIHSAGIAIMIDTGFWSLFLLLSFLAFVQKKYSLLLVFFASSNPIFSLDHFGYSTISGQNLFLFFIIFLYLKFIIINPIKVRK